MDEKLRRKRSPRDLARIGRLSELTLEELIGQALVEPKRLTLARSLMETNRWNIDNWRRFALRDAADLLGSDVLYQVNLDILKACADELHIIADDTRSFSDSRRGRLVNLEDVNQIDAALRIYNKWLQCSSEGLMLELIQWRDKLVDFAHDAIDEMQQDILDTISWGLALPIHTHAERGTIGEQLFTSATLVSQVALRHVLSTDASLYTWQKRKLAWYLADPRYPESFQKEKS